MRGQITLEYMVLSLVVVALLAIALSALIQIRENSNKAMDIVLFKSAARDLYNAIDEACAMGDGNSREVFLKKEVIVNDGVEFLELSSPLSHVEGAVKYRCPCSVDSGDTLSGNVVVTNNEGEIEFTT